MPLGQTLADSLLGVNRPALDNQVMQTQYLNGLRSAQTEDALARAQSIRDEQDAAGKLEDAFVGMGTPRPQARAQSLIMKAKFGNAQQALEAMKLQQEVADRGVLSDPTKLNSPDQTAAMQGVQGRVAEPIKAPEEYILPAGVAPPEVHQTPLGVAQTGAANSLGGLRHEQALHGSKSASSLSDDAAYNAAIRYNLTGVMPALGMGGSGDRAKILDFAARLSTDDNWHPPSWDQPAGATGPAGGAHPTRDNAMAPITGAGGFKAHSAALNDLTKRTSLVDAAESTANQNLDLAHSYLTKADQSGSPLINLVQNKIRSGLMGDPDVSAYTNALTVAANEYARVVSMATGAAGITNAAREEGQRLFNPTLSPQQLAANIDVARQEMANRSGSMHDQIGRAKRGLTGAPGAAPPAGPAPAAATPAPAVAPAAPAAGAVSLDQYLKGKGF